LRAVIGTRSKIEEIRRELKAKYENLPIKLNKLQQLEILSKEYQQVQLSLLKTEKVAEDIADITIIIQNLVANSSLSLSLPNIISLPGVYNPCISQNSQLRLLVLFI